MKTSKSCGSVPAAADATAHNHSQQQDVATTAAVSSGPAWFIHPKLNPPPPPAAAGSQGSTSPAGSLSSGLRRPPSSQSTGTTPGTRSSGQDSISPAASILPSASVHAAGAARTQQPLAARSRSHQVLSAAQGSRAAAGGPSSSSTSSQTLSNLQPGLQPEAARALQQQLARSFAAARILEGGQCRDHPAPKASRAARLRRSRTSHAVLWSLSNGGPRPLSRSNSRAANRQPLGRTRSSQRPLAGVGTHSAAASLAAAAAAAAAEEESEEEEQGVAGQPPAAAVQAAGESGSTRSSKEQDTPAASKEGGTAAAAPPAAAAKAPTGVVPAKSAVTLSKVVVELPASGSATAHGPSNSNSSGPEGLSGGPAAPGSNPSSSNGSGSNKSCVALAPDMSSKASRKALVKHRATASNATAALAAAAVESNSGNGATAADLGGSSSGSSGSSSSSNNLGSGSSGAGGEGSAAPPGTLSSSSSGRKLWSGSSTIPGAKRPSGRLGVNWEAGVADGALLEGEEAQQAASPRGAPAAAAAALPASPKAAAGGAGATTAALKAPMPALQGAVGAGGPHSRAAKKKKKKGFFWCCSAPSRFSSDEEPVNAAGEANSQAPAVKLAGDAKGPVLPELDFQKQQDTIMVGYVTAHSTQTQSTDSLGELVMVKEAAAGSSSAKEPSTKGPSGARALLKSLSERAREGWAGKELGLELPAPDRAWRAGSSVPTTPGAGHSGKSSGTGEAFNAGGQLAGSAAGEAGTLLSPGSPGRNSVTWGPNVSSSGGGLTAAVAAAAAAAAAVKQERLSSSSNSSSGGGEGVAPKPEQAQDNSSAAPAGKEEDEEVVEVAPSEREIHAQPWQQHLAVQRAKAGSPCNKIPLKLSARSPKSTARSSQAASNRSTPRSSRSPGRGVGHVTLTVTPGATFGTDTHPGDSGVTLKAMALQALHGSRCTSDSVDEDRSLSDPVPAEQAAGASPVAEPGVGIDSSSSSVQPPAPCTVTHSSSSSSSKQPAPGGASSSSSTFSQSVGAPALSPVQQMQQVAAAVSQMQQANATRRAKSPPRSAGRAAGGDAAQQAGSGASPRLQQQPWHTQQQDKGAGVPTETQTAAAAGAALAAAAPANPHAVASVVSLGQLAEPRSATKPVHAAAPRKALPAVAQLAEAPCTTTLHLSDLVGPTSSSCGSGAATAATAAAAAAPAKEASRASFSGPVQSAALAGTGRSPATAAAVALIQAAGSSLAASIRSGSSRRLSAAVAASGGSVASSRRTTCSNLPSVEEMGSLSGGVAALRRSSSSLHGRSLLQMDPVGVAAAKFKVPEGVVSAALDSQAPHLRLSDAEEAVSFRWLPHARLRSRSPEGTRGHLGVRSQRGRVTRCTLRSNSRLLQQTHNFRSFAEADAFLGFGDAVSGTTASPAGAAAAGSRRGSQLGSRAGSVTSATASVLPFSSGGGGRKGAKGGRSSPFSRAQQQQRSSVQQVKGEGAWRHPLSPRGGVDCKQSPRGCGGSGAVSAGVAAAMLAQLRGETYQQGQQGEQKVQLEGTQASTAAASLGAAQEEEPHGEEVATEVGAASPAAQGMAASPTGDLTSASSDAAAAAGDGEVTPAATSPRLTEGQQGAATAAAAAAAAAQPATPVRTPRITPQEVAEPPQDQEAEDGGSSPEVQAGGTSARVTRVTRGDSFRVSGEAGADAVTEDAAGTTADAEAPVLDEEDVEEVVIASIDGAITALAAAPAVVARLSGAGGRLSAGGTPPAAVPGRHEEGQVQGASSTLHTTFNLGSMLATATAGPPHHHEDSHYPEQQQQQQLQKDLSSSPLHATGGHSRASKTARTATAGRAGPAGGSSPTRSSIKGVQPSSGGTLPRYGSSVAAATSTLMGVSAAAAAGGGVAGVGLSTSTMRRISAEQRLQSIDREALRRSLPYLQRGNADFEAEEGEHTAWSASGRSAAAARSSAGATRSPARTHQKQPHSTAEHIEGGTAATAAAAAGGGGRGGWSPVCRSPVPAGVVDLDSEGGLMQLEAEGQQWLEVLSQTSHDSEVPASLYSPARRATTSAMSTRRSSARRSSTAAGPGASSTSGSGARMSSTDAGGHVQQRRRSSVGARGSERRSSAGEGSPQRRLSRQESYLRMLQAGLQHRHQQQAEHSQQLQVQQQEASHQEEQEEEREQEQEGKQEEEQEQQPLQEEETVAVQQQEEVATPAEAPVMSTPAADVAEAEPSGPAEAPPSDAGSSSSGVSSGAVDSTDAGSDAAADASDAGPVQASQAGLQEVEAPQQQQEVVCEEAVVDACSSEGGTESCGNCSSFSSQPTEWEHDEAGGVAPAAGVSSAGGAAVDTGKDWEEGEGECDE